GSGNARVGSYQKDDFQAISIENGTGRFQREIAKQAADSKRPFADVSVELRESLIAKPLREKLAVQDLIAGKSEATIVGGASWALSTLTQPGRIRDTRVPVSTDDLARFAKIARLPVAEARMIVLESVSDPELRKAAAAEVDR